jgi:hypothetical protein
MNSRAAVYWFVGGAFALGCGCAHSVRPDTGIDAVSSEDDAIASSDTPPRDAQCSPSDPPRPSSSSLECTASDQAECQRWATSQILGTRAFGVCVSTAGVKLCYRAERCRVVDQDLAPPFVECACGAESECSAGWVCAGTSTPTCVRPCSR